MQHDNMKGNSFKTVANSVEVGVGISGIPDYRSVDRRSISSGDVVRQVVINAVIKLMFVRRCKQSDYVKTIVAPPSRTHNNKS